MQVNVNLKLLKFIYFIDIIIISNELILRFSHFSKQLFALIYFNYIIRFNFYLKVSIRSYSVANFVRC